MSDVVKLYNPPRRYFVRPYSKRRQKPFPWQEDTYEGFSGLMLEMLEDPEDFEGWATMVAVLPDNDRVSSLLA